MRFAVPLVLDGYDLTWKISAFVSVEFCAERSPDVAPRHGACCDRFAVAVVRRLSLSLLATGASLREALNKKEAH